LVPAEPKSGCITIAGQRAVMVGRWLSGEMGSLVSLAISRATVGELGCGVAAVAPRVHGRMSR
jgi:hypothetical protein